jgi:outer membrane protein
MTWNSTSNRRAGRILVAALLIIPAGLPVVAQDQPVEMTISTSPREQLPPSGLESETAEKTLQLPLQEAVAVALERNLPLLVQRYERAQMRLGIDQNLGIYDLSLTYDGYANEDTTPSSSALAGADILVRKQQSHVLGLSQVTPLGGVGGVSLSSFRQEDNSTFSNPNPAYLVDFDLSFTQPLLRNFGRDTTEYNLKVARLNSSISREAFEQQVIATIQEVDNAYWDLVEARAQLEVAHQSLELAQELHQMNKVRVDVGTLAPIELVQSEAGVATREEEIIRAQAAVEDAEDVLRQLLNLEGGTLWSVSIVPSTDPKTERIDVDLDQAIDSAFQSRSELAAKDLEIDTLKLTSAVLRNQKRPRLDLSVRYGYNGLGGDTFVPEDGADPLAGNTAGTIVPGGIGDAFDQIGSFDFDGWRIDLNFGFPIQNREAKARSAIADLDLEQGQAELDDLRQQILREVRTAVRGVRTAAQQIDSAQVSRRLAEKNLEAEQKRYENGLSTSFQVLQIQEDLTSARSREVTAITTYRRALAEYYRATGRMLEANDIELADDSQLMASK